MGLFDKLFGNSKEGKEAKEALSFLEKLVKEKEAQEAAKKKTEPAKPAQPAEPVKPAEPEYEEEDGPSGFSYGPKMPAEPNQYNFGGTYLDYFKTVYAEEFPTLRQEIAKSKYSSGVTEITLWDGARKALVVELLSQKCEVKALRKKCAEQNIPYVRFYYDYHGWWNTREYVVTRSKEAMTR